MTKKERYYIECKEAYEKAEASYEYLKATAQLDYIEESVLLDDIEYLKVRMWEAEDEINFNSKIFTW